MKFSWNQNMTSQPRLVLTAEDPSFDSVTIQNWKDEGYDVTYLPFTGSRPDFERNLQHLADPLEMGEKYAIVAYGESATVALDMCIKPMPKLCALIAYYPNRIPSPAAGFPPSLRVLVHVAGSQGLGPKFHSYSYPEARPGFAEVDLEEYDQVSASLAWTRTLAAVRKGFEIDVDLEKVWEKHIALEFVTRDVDATMATMVTEPYVNHVPTLTGGIGYEDLHRFYRDYFIPCNPPSMKMRLVSRTLGTDRVVDEIYVKFRHTQEIPWMLPGVDATDKEIEVALVVVVCIHGGKLQKEHIYWDQATVLVQAGLLDPKFLPGGGKAAIQLPVVDGAGARKVLDVNSVKSNELIESW